MHSTTGQIGVVWLSHGNKQIRCHPTQLRRCSEGEISIASLKSLVQIPMPTKRDRINQCSVSWTIQRPFDQFAD